MHPNKSSSSASVELFEVLSDVNVWGCPLGECPHISIFVTTCVGGVHTVRDLWDIQFIWWIKHSALLVEAQRSCLHSLRKSVRGEERFKCLKVKWHFLACRLSPRFLFKEPVMKCANAVVSPAPAPSSFYITELSFCFDAPTRRAHAAPVQPAAESWEMSWCS